MMKFCPLWFSMLVFGAPNVDLAHWLTQQEPISWLKLSENISPPGTARGTIIAARSKSSPDYFYHWTRDAGLVMDVVRRRYERSGDAAERAKLLTAFDEFVQLSRKQQSQNNLSGPAWGMGMAEPKYFVDGRAFDGGWGRPQTDGPAIRAAALISMANTLSREGDTTRHKHWYDGQHPSYSVIKADLEFVASHWQSPSFDLWEEVKGAHFYTQMVQRKALVLGAAFALSQGDAGAADHYAQEADKIKASLETFWNETNALIEATHAQTEGIGYKDSQMDSAVILAALHGALDDGFFTPWDSRVLVSLSALSETFATLYPVNRVLKNQRGEVLAPAIGRYPEDKYDGLDSDQEANPWFLTTSAFAETLSLAVSHWAEQGKIAVDANLVAFFTSLDPAFILQSGETLKESDPRFISALQLVSARSQEYLNRVRYHAGRKGELSEQFNRYSGKLRGASELTWSHAALLTAKWAMDGAQKSLQSVAQRVGAPGGR